MPRTKKGAGKGLTSQGVRDAKTTIQQAKKKARALLKQAGKDVRTVRHEVAQLKKAGLVTKRLNVRSYLPSKYMLKKIEQNADVLRGEMVAVKAPKNVRTKYAGIFEPRGSSLIVPREFAEQKTRITRGMVEMRRDLRFGEEVRLVLPFKAADMEGVAHKLLADPTLEGMKRPDELFGFRLFGHNMNTIGFPNAEELAQYILTNYAHLFSGKDGRQGVKHFQLFRFRSKNSQMQPGPEDQRQYSPRKKSDNRRGSRDYVIKKRLQRDAARKAKQRDKETKAERQARLDYQRRYAATKRQRDWEGQ